MEINWLKLGYELARLVITSAFVLILSGQIYTRYIFPELQAELEKASETITNVAKLAGVKSAEYRSSKNIEKSVARDIIEKQIPELELVKTFVSPATWEEIEDTLENNPEAVIQLWDKYGHLFKGVQTETESEYDF